MSGFEAYVSITETERQVLLLDHIASGIALLQSGQNEEAFNHFAQYNLDSDFVPQRERPGLNLVIGIRTLLSKDDLVKETRSVVSRNWYQRPSHNLKITGYHIQGPYNENIDRDRFDPELVEQLQKEIAMGAAEEWLHAAQHASDTSLTGELDHEVDVAAYFMNMGIGLSLDFITRYSGRTTWYSALFPEKAEEIADFIAKYGPGL